MYYGFHRSRSELKWKLKIETPALEIVLGPDSQRDEPAGMLGLKGKDKIRDGDDCFVVGISTSYCRRFNHWWCWSLVTRRTVLERAVDDHFFPTSPTRIEHQQWPENSCNFSLIDHYHWVWFRRVHLVLCLHTCRRCCDMLPRVKQTNGRVRGVNKANEEPECCDDDSDNDVESGENLPTTPCRGTSASWAANSPPSRDRVWYDTGVRRKRMLKGNPSLQRFVVAFWVFVRLMTISLAPFSCYSFTAAESSGLWQWQHNMLPYLEL